LKNVSESLSLAMQLAGFDMTDVYYGRLERRKSKIPDLHSNFNETPTSAATGQQRTGFYSGVFDLRKLESHFGVKFDFKTLENNFGGRFDLKKLESNFGGRFDFKKVESYFGDKFDLKTLENNFAEMVDLKTLKNQFGGKFDLKTLENQFGGKFDPESFDWLREARGRCQGMKERTEMSVRLG
jgi:hypothetical protein